MKEKIQKKIRTPMLQPKSCNLKAASGFTLIEVMIAMSIFTVIVIIGMGAVLDAISEHYRTENLSTVMDNLNFTLEDMARNIRLGSNVECVLTGTPSYVAGVPAPQDCPGIPGVSAGSNMIVFQDLSGNTVIYDITPPAPLTVAPLVPLQIYKQKTATSAPQIISPPEVTMDYSKSGFTVRGSLPGDQGQPTVVIRLAGYVTYKNTRSTFAIQTTVELRALDS